MLGCVNLMPPQVSSHLRVLLGANGDGVRRSPPITANRAYTLIRDCRHRCSLNNKWFMSLTPGVT